MVRLKHRYLLLQILYPSAVVVANQTHNSSSTLSSSEPPNWPLTFHSPSPDTLTPQLLLRLIRDTISSLFGDYGASATTGSLAIKYLSTATSTAIVRCSRADYRIVWGALNCITHLPLSKGENRQGKQGLECAVVVVRTSGTMRKSVEEGVRRAKMGILRARRAAAVGGEGLGLGEGGYEDGVDVSMDDGIEDMDGDEEEDEEDDEEEQG